MLDDNAERSGVQTNESEEAVLLSAETVGSTMRGIVDVLTFRALMRAVRFFLRGEGQSDEEDFNRAVVKVINTSGALAKALLDVRK